MAMMPPSVASSSGAAASGVMSWLQSPGLSAIGAGLGALGGMSPSSSAESNTGPVTATGWGTFNNPFILSTRGSTVSDVTTRTDADTTLDNRPTGGQGSSRAPIIEGGSSLLALFAIGAVAFVVAGLIKRGA